MDLCGNQHEKKHGSTLKSLQPHLPALISMPPTKPWPVGLPA